MVRRRSRFVLALACALAAMLCSAAYAQGVRRDAESVRAETIERYGGESTTLVVATRPLAAGEALDSDSVAEREWPSELVPEGSFASLDDVVGQTTAFPVERGLPLTEASLAGGEAALEVPAGTVAVSLGRPGELALPEGAGVGASVVAYELDDDGARVVAEDVRILALGQAQGSLVRGSAVTLAVRPRDVAGIMRCASQGTLRLVVPADDVDASELGESESAAAPEAVGALEGTGRDAAGGEGHLGAAPADGAGGDGGAAGADDGDAAAATGADDATETDEQAAGGGREGD